MCFFRYPAIWKDFPQESHLWFLCPSWSILMCLFRDNDKVKDFPQESHLKFLEPWWFLICKLSSFCNPKDLLHTLQMNFLSSPWIRLICWFWYCLVEKLFSHISHSNFLSSFFSISRKIEQGSFNYLTKLSTD